MSSRVGHSGTCGVIFGHSESFNTRLPAALEENLDLLLRGPQGALAMACQLHAALEGPQSFLQRKIATLQALHKALQLPERVLEVGRLGRLGRWLRIARQISSSKWGATLHSTPFVGNSAQAVCELTIRALENTVIQTVLDPV